MYLDDALLYNQGYMISINDLDSPLFYLFDYDSRSFKINMSFQHFHQFHEIHILLSGRASHLIEGDYLIFHVYDDESSKAYIHYIVNGKTDYIRAIIGNI